MDAFVEVQVAVFQGEGAIGLELALEINVSRLQLAVHAEARAQRLAGVKTPLYPCTRFQRPRIIEREKLPVQAAIENPVLGDFPTPLRKRLNEEISSLIVHAP